MMDGVIGNRRMVATRGALSGVAAGIAFGAWMTIYGAASGMGAWNWVNVCLASFVFRGVGAASVNGMSMAAPLQASHLTVGLVLHLAFSALTGVAFAVVLRRLAGSARLDLLRTWPGYVAGSVVGGLILLAVMLWIILPPLNPVMDHSTPRGPFLVGHLIFGAVFGLVAFRWLGPAAQLPRRPSGAVPAGR